MFHLWPFTKIAKKNSSPLNKMAASAKKLAPFQNNFSEMFLSICPFTKSAQMVLLRWRLWPPELKLEKKKL